MIKVTSNKATVIEVKKVRAILDTFVYEGFKCKIRTRKGKTTLELEKDDDENWPEAVKSDQMPSAEQFKDEDAWYDAQIEVFVEKGTKGFRALLLELAPFLQTPLVILAAEWEDGFAAATWSVQPDGKEVRELFVGF